MMKFECKDMEMDCDFVATADTKAEVLDMAMAHALEVHGDMFQGLSAEQTAGMNAQVGSVIRDGNVAEAMDEEETEEDEIAEDADEEAEIVEDEEEDEEESGEVA